MNMIVFLIIVLFSSNLYAHEVWLLTPNEIIELSQKPLPDLFTTISPFNMWLVVILCGVLTVLLFSENLWKPIEYKFEQKTQTVNHYIAGFILRIGLGIMLFTAALGLSPRHGTAFGFTPTLFVPDMELNLLGSGWHFLAYVQLILAIMLLYGFFTRVASLGVIGLCYLGLGLFQEKFIPYMGHFIAPAVFLMWTGGGYLSIPVKLHKELQDLIEALKSIKLQWVYSFVLFITGINFFYLGLFVKGMYPTLLMAILAHGNVPLLGLSYETAAFIMTGIEIAAGLLVALGLLVRPIAIFLIAAMSFFAIFLGESPLLHANIYTLMFVFLIYGDKAETFESSLSSFREAIRPDLKRRIAI